MATGISSAFQDWLATSRTIPRLSTTSAQMVASAAEVRGDQRLVTRDVIARQNEQRRDQNQDPQRPPRPLAERLRLNRLVMLHAKQDQLLLADRLILLDEHFAAGERVVMFGHLVARDLAEQGGLFLLVAQRRSAVEPLGDELEQDLADPRRGERGDEFFRDRTVGLDDPLGNDPLAGKTRASSRG